jgi:hypothetical protein
VRGRTDAPVADVRDELPATPRDAALLADLAAELGIESSVERLHRAISAALGAAAR